MDFSIRHFIPGRIRLHVPTLCRKRSLAEALRQSDVRKRLADLSAEPVSGTPAETAAFMRAEVDRWNNVIKAANVKLE